MKTLSITTLLLLSISFGIFATEPDASNCTWDYYLSVETIYTGDYNKNSGLLLFNCTNSKSYSIELGTEMANLIYASAMTAFTKSKKLDIYRSRAKEYDGTYRIYRVNIRN